MDLAASGFGASSSKDVKGFIPCNTSGEKNAFIVPHVTLGVILNPFSPLAELREWPAGEKLTVPLLVPTAQSLSVLIVVIITH